MSKNNAHQGIVSRTIDGFRQKSFPVQILIIVSLLVIPPLAISQSTQTNNAPLTLTILHTNDLHAHDLPYMERGKDIGGMARIAYLIKTIKNSAKNPIVIDAGDIFQGTPMFKLYHGETEVESLNLAGYDIYTIGNHEFDNGPHNLAKQLACAKFDVVSSNLDAHQVPELERLIKPSVVKTIGSEKIGFVGAITPDLEHLTMDTGGVHVLGISDAANAGMSTIGWITPIKNEVQKLECEGINKIVLITHCGVEQDKLLAQEIPEADIIVGGHSHTRLSQPIVVSHPDGESTTIVQTGSYGRALGKLVVDFDSQGRVIRAKTDYKLINITNRIPEDPKLSAYLSEKSRPLMIMRQDVLSKTSAEFDNQFRRFPYDSALGDLITDAIADFGKQYGVTIALQNRGGIRSRMEVGNITMETVEEILPFENSAVFATISGATLMNIMEHSVSGGLGAWFLDVHGLKFGYDPQAAPGHRIAFLLALSSDGNYKPIDAKSEYKIAINDFSFEGGEGYDFSSAKNIERTKVRLASILATYLRKHPTLVATGPSRIVAVTPGVLTLYRAEQRPDTTMPIKLHNENSLGIKSPIGTAYATIYAGRQEGVSPLSSKLDIPVLDPQVVAKNILVSPSNELIWSPASIGKREYIIKDGTWYAIALSKTRSGQPTIISAPVRY